MWGSKDGGVIDRNTGVKWGTFENRDDFVMSQNLSNMGWDHPLRRSSCFYHHGPSCVGFTHEEEQKRERKIAIV